MSRKGIVPLFDFASLSLNKYGIIRKQGGWFTMCDPFTGEILMNDDKPVKVNGLARVYEYLENNPDYYNSITDYILKDINGEDSKVTGEDDLL